MSLIMFHNASGGGVTVCCSRCSSIVGEMTLAEVGELSTHRIEVLCFDCDLVGVDDLPRQLFCPQDNYLIGYDNMVFLAEWVSDNSMPEARDLRMSRISLTTYFDLKTGFGPRMQSLSSSLNLNKKSQKGGAFLGDREVMQCSR